MSNLSSKSKGGNEFIDVDAALGAELDEVRSRYDERDLALYALGVGAGKNPTDSNDLRVVFERNGDGFYALPTYGVVPALNAIFKSMAEGKTAPGLNYGLDRILHGEQYTEVIRPLPLRRELVHKARISDIFDKGKNAIVVTHVDSYDAETGELLVKNDVAMVVRGAGGWGGDRGPSHDVNVPPSARPTPSSPRRRARARRCSIGSRATGTRCTSTPSSRRCSASRNQSCTASARSASWAAPS